MSELHLVADLVSRLSPPDTPAKRYTRDALEPELVRVLLTAAQIAPSADNAQIWRFVSVESDDDKSRLAQAVSENLRPSVERSALVLVACGVRFVVSRARREQPFAMVDVPIAVTHILLKAAETGLDCTWTLQLDEDLVRQTLGVPDGVRVVALMALG